MTIRFKLAVVAVVALVAAFTWHASAQTQRQPATRVAVENSGIGVEEVRVGNSCVVVVWLGGAGQNQIAAVPCGS